ncbi:MAG: hypothetical protein Q4D29_10455 [Lachnospiraceae bacterium]|nr:hypothetical protein [Lachnospiraceae bacterium]
MEDKLKRIKRIFALVGAVVLVCMYVLTLVFAITDNPETMSFFKASAVLTIVLPILIYAYQLVYRVIKLMSEGKDK